MMKRHLVMMLCLIRMAASMNAQSITGKLVDEKNEPLAYANIVLQQADSTFVKGETSDERAVFASRRCRQVIIVWSFPASVIRPCM